MKALVWIGRALGALGMIVVLLFAAGWLYARHAANKVYVVNDPPLAMPTDAERLARGEHLFITKGCSDCHGRDGSGLEVVDAGPVFRAIGSNITPPALAAKGYDADRIAAAIRHGVKPDGRPLFFMPAGDFVNLSDADTADLIAYIQNLPPSDSDPGTSTLRPLGWVLHLFGQFPAYPAAQLDHTPRQRTAPPVAASVEYGAYLAQVCTGCHGTNLAGLPPHAPGAPPAADLTPRGLQGWSEADFVRVMREGKRPDGRELHPMMPWRTLGQLSDVELQALWLYLRSLPEA